MIWKRKKRSDGSFPDDEDWFKTPLFQILNELFERMEKEPEELRRLNANPEESAYMAGMSYRISSDGINPTKIEVNRLGPRGWESVQGKISGTTPATKIKKSAKLPTSAYQALKVKPIKGVKQPSTYEEAPYTYSIDTNKVTIELKVSGIEKEENIDLRFYPESLEIKAVTPKVKKGYFAVLKVPAQIDQENTKIKLEKDKVVIIIPRKYPIIRGVER